MMHQHDEPVYVISVAARMVNLHAQTLRSYERGGLLQPARSHGGVRMYSEADIQRLRLIRRLVDDLGVNLAGVDVVLNMTARINELQGEIERLRDELQRARDRNLPVPQRPPS